MVDQKDNFNEVMDATLRVIAELGQGIPSPEEETEICTGDEYLRTFCLRIEFFTDDDDNYEGAEFMVDCNGVEIFVNTVSKTVIGVTNKDLETPTAYHEDAMDINGACKAWFESRDFHEDLSDNRDFFCRENGREAMGLRMVGHPFGKPNKW